jgi:hypothetical protein
MENYIIIVVGFVCTLISTLITLWLNEKVRGSVQASFNKSLEEVKKEHSKEIAQFQIELNHLKSKENFKFTKLHEKRFEVLQKTYKYVNENIVFLGRLVSIYKEIPDNVSEEENEKKLRLKVLRLN